MNALHAPGTDDDLTYTYDTCANGSGRLCSVVNAAATVTYGYDAFGGVTAHQGVSYGYDHAGRIQQITYPSGAIVQLTYNAAGQVTKVDRTQSAISNVARNLRYFPFSPLRSAIFGNLLTFTQGADSAYRLTSQTVPGVFERGYPLYDGNGNLLARTDNLTASTDQFTYDPLNRLDIEIGESSRDFDYDQNGNRLAQTKGAATTAYTYQPNTNRVATLDGRAVMLDANLDANGNTTSPGTGRVYSYTTLNQLSKATQTGALLARYAYNGLGQRARKTLADGTVTQYVYGLDGELLAELDATGTPQVEYIHLNGAPLAMVQSPTGAPKVYYLHNDPLSTPRRATDENGVVVWAWQGDAFGNTLPDEDPDNDGVATEINLRFPGQYYDEETGLHYNYHRYYDPSTGRYITSDPIGLDGGLNTYAYVSSNPLRFIDPLGNMGQRPQEPWEFPKKQWQLPGKCETEDQCWETARNNILKCGVNRNCQLYWRWYQTQCPDKRPDSSCPCEKK
jgi:RHS repeat-associated protein